jgi:hypothetical protein
MEENLKNRPKGRPKGSSNLLNRDIKKIIAEIVEQNLATLQDELDQMKPSEKAKIIISLLEHVSPKLRSVETNDITEQNFKPIQIKFN